MAAVGFSPLQPQPAVASEVGGAPSVLSVSFMSAESHHSEGRSSHDGELDETLQSEVNWILYSIPLHVHTSACRFSSEGRKTVIPYFFINSAQK